MIRLPHVLAGAGFQVLQATSSAAQAVVERAGSFSDRFKIASTVSMVAPDVSFRASRLFETIRSATARLPESRAYLGAYFSQFPELFDHAASGRLLEIVTTPAPLGNDGFPRVLPESFRSFVDGVPHLFAGGQAVLDWLDRLEGALNKRPQLSAETVASVRNARQALRTLVQTAAVTAPPDLWLMRQILATHRETRVLEILEKRGEVLCPGDGQYLDLDPEQLDFDLQFLWARGIVDRSGEGYVKAAGLPYGFGPELDLPGGSRDDLANLLSGAFASSSPPAEESRIRRWLEMPRVSRRRSSARAWTPSLHELEVGFRLLPVVLALGTSGALRGHRAGDRLPDIRWNAQVRRLLTEGGLLTGGRMSALGARVFERGPGVYGIIGAYQPFLEKHASLLSATGERPWVQRGKNIAASRDANRKSFRTAVEILDDYARAKGARYPVVIEHALGLGIGIQEFGKAFGDEKVIFIGADYEETALEGARRERDSGRLPSQMKFVQADIGRPETLLHFLRGQEIDPRGAVMIVGNGLHEARGKSDADMIEVFRQYCEAGILLIFTEESGLTDPQIRDAAWNTYHAGFRWTHQVSGQGLRAPWPMDPPSERLSWVECAERAGYRVPKEYRRGTRTIFPYDLPESRNPPISVTFLCLPQ